MKKQLLLLTLTFSFCAVVKAQITYTFIGNGNWSDSANWQNQQKPPDNLPDNSIININPLEGGQCIVDVPVTLPPTATLNVLAGKILNIPGNMTFAGAGTVTDIDGNVYHTVKIGVQTWMVENLKTTHFRNGEEISNVIHSNGESVYSNYNNNDSYVTPYGRLYNWYAVADSRQLAPAGWHIPTDAEWDILINYLGGYDMAGGKMKDTSAYWEAPNTSAINSSGFSGLPGGSRNTSYGNFLNLGYAGWWWSSTEYYTDYVWLRSLTYNSAKVNRSNTTKEFGLSVRCVKD